MKIYKVTIKKNDWDNSPVEKTILAATIEKALENAKRYCKKNYFTSSEVKAIEHVMNIDIVYKS